MASNKIDTEKQLLDFEKSTYEKVNPLKSERENLWRKYKRAKTVVDKKCIEDKIIAISKQITPLTEDIRLCEEVQSRMERIKKIELHQRLKKDIKKENMKNGKFR